MRTASSSAPEATHGAPAPSHGEARTFARPVVVLSKCLEMEACRFNGQVVRSDLVRRLDPWVDFVTVCPEVEIGLGVPRDPVRLVQIDGASRLLQPASGRDVSDDMDLFATGFVEGLEVVDGFLLKGRSPSCGIRDVKVYAAPEKAPPVGKEAGRFAAHVLERHPDAAIEDEGRLRNPTLRAHFLTKIFTRAGFRAVRRSGVMRELVAFHAAHKLLFMAYDQHGMRALGKLVGNQERRSFDEVARAYADGLNALLQKPPKRTAVVNVVQHAFGYFSEDLTARERRYFLDLLERYRTGRAGLSPVLAVLGGWIARFDQTYLADQSLFEPFPRPLAVLDEV